ncbi:DMT family transporter [Terasakiella sp. A23]|uniref:DMT family transporter n=1 Tax=Terasakiella sp. FCG-A23 TaxID=3080561 RepID=UPI0029549DB9|nr:DMT family transporter [Terasakiella sp. A23]MDV7340789.1 DMT family transporter [Terasakiella sp. A23]
METQMRLTDWILLILLSLIWGGSFYYAEIALREASPLVVVWGRVAGAAVILLLVLRIKGIPFPKGQGLWIAFFVMGLLNNVIPFTLIVWGQTAITGSLASIFNATTPLFTIVLAQFLTQDEKINLLKVVGLLLGFAGVIVMVGVEALSGLSGVVLAQIAVLAAAISYGCAAIWGRRFKGINPMVTATGQVTCSGFVMTPIALFFGFPDGYFVPTGEVLFAIGFMALVCTVFAYILYFKILATSGATNLMLVTFLVPLSAIALGSLFLGEQLSTDQLIGMGLILFGLLIIDGRLFKRP